MFNCCLRKKVNFRPVVTTDLIVPNKQSLINSSKPPPPPTPPTSPPLKQAEIDKIKLNLKKLFTLNQSVYLQQGQILDEVFNRLKGSSQHQSPDPKSNGWKEILTTVIGFVCVAAENPAVDVASLLVIGVVDYLTDNENFKDNPDLYLDVDCSDISARLTKTYNATQIYLGYMSDDPNTYRDQQFSNFDKTYTLKDLINTDLPDEGTSLFSITVQLNGRSFRRQITIPEMIKMNFWDIYKVQDDHSQDSHTSSDNFGMVFRLDYMDYFKNWKSFERNRDFNKENVGVGCRIHANDEVLRYHSGYVHAEGYGNNNDDLTASYLNSISSFIEQWPACIIGPWTITDKKKYDFRFYIMEGYGKISTYSHDYAIANGEFMKWLFIDDGAGNVINTEGVLYRCDALTCGIFSYASLIPKDNFVDGGENIMVRNTEYKYSYPGCRESVTSNRVYCGDF